MLGSVVCSPTRTDTTHEPAPADTVQLLIETDKSEYAPGEAITATLTVVNATDQAVTLEFMSGQRYDLMIRTAEDREVWRWGLTRGFPQVLGSMSMDPSARRAYTEVVDENLSSGAYTLVGVLTSRNFPLEASVGFTVR